MTVAEPIGTVADPGVAMASRHVTWNPTRRPTVYIYRECGDETFCAQVASLPGVLSEGSSREEAACNIREALLAAIESYRDRGLSVPWEPRLPLPEAAEVEVRAITLDA